MTAQNASYRTTAAPGNDATAEIRSGIGRMFDTSAALAKPLSAKDTARISQLGDQLEEQWSSFEDQVKPRFPGDYEQVEKFLDPLRAGTKASPLDVTTLSQLNHSLTHALQTLQDKLS